MNRDSKIRRSELQFVLAKILKSAPVISTLHYLLWSLIAEVSFTFKLQPVLWLVPLWESMRTFKRLSVLPTYVPKLHLGQKIFMNDSRLHQFRQGIFKFEKAL